MASGMNHAIGRRGLNLPKRTMRIVSIPAIAILAALLAVAEGWVATTPSLVSSLTSVTSANRGRARPITTQRLAQQPPPHGDNNENSDHTPPPPRHVHLVAWEGCLVDTVHWRTTQGLAICRHVWPDLDVMLRDDDDDANENADNDSMDHHQWLYNKVRDLHHVLVLDPAYSPTVEYALLIRLLLEEQELDQGRSNGSRGKYGSKYHPSADNTAFASTNDESLSSSNPRQQRPLTVGEIATNWQGSLREAAMIRYHREEGHNPLDLLQQALVKTQTRTSLDDKAAPTELTLQQDDINVLRENGDSIIVLAPHEADLPAVQASLRSILAHQVYETAEQALSSLHPVKKQNSVAVVCRTKQTVRQTLAALPPQSTLSVWESSWPLLLQSVPLFGDCIPRDTSRPQKCSALDVQLQLCLWRARHPNDHAAALMNAWTHCHDKDMAWPDALQPLSTSSQRG